MLSISKYNWKKRMKTSLSEKLKTPVFRPQVCPPLCGTKTSKKWTFDWRLDPFRKYRKYDARERLRKSISDLFKLPEIITKPITVRKPRPSFPSRTVRQLPGTEPQTVRRTQTSTSTAPTAPSSSSKQRTQKDNKALIALGLGGLALLALMGGGKK